MSPRVDPAPNPAQDPASAVLERRLRDLCNGERAFSIGALGWAVRVADVLAILDDPDPLGH